MTEYELKYRKWLKLGFSHSASDELAMLGWEQFLYYRASKK